MRYLSAILLLVLFSCSSPTEQLHSLLDEIENHQPLSEEEQQKYPLGRFTEADFQAGAEYAENAITRLDAIDKNGLSLTDRISLELMKYQLQEEIDQYNFKGYLNPILVDDGFHISFAQRPTYYSFLNEEDYENYLNDLNAFPTYAQQHIDLMREGLKIGMTQPKAILDGYDVTYSTHIVEDLEQSLFLQPFLNFPQSFSESKRKELLEKGGLAVKNGAIKGYELIRDFFEQEYFPGAQDKIGASNLPNGEAFYQNRADYYTTLDMSVEEIHNTGLSEVERIKAEMETVKAKANFDGSLKEFIQFLRTDPQFYPKTGRELLTFAAYLSKKADGKLPALFKLLPRQPYTIEPVAPHLAPKYTGGRYSGAALESTRPGEYWVNTYNLPSRPLYVMTALTLHEAVPGHHLQGALTQEFEHIPNFRNNMYISAYGEGWGLYSEFLGVEMGMYETPYDDFGRLTYEMWRACRLVVDTGIHAYGWQRQQVIDYLAENTALSIHECTTETDRYISWPGQALSYKIGELKIKELRKKASDALGESFDVREFHDAVLSEGTLTLPLLEQVIDAYIEEKSAER